MSIKKINATNDPSILVVERTKNKEIILTGVFNVMGSIIESRAESLEEDFRHLTLVDGEVLDLFGPIKKVIRRGDTLEYHFRRPGGFMLVINRDDLVKALAKPPKPWWWPF